MERQFSPAKWGYVLTNASKAYQADCPTLLDYDSIYGQGKASDWVYLQVLALYGSSASREKGMADGIELFAQSFSAAVKTYKLSELMLFFARYRAGQYDNSFTTFDARRIGNAFFKEFLPQRNAEIDKLVKEEEQQAIEQRRFTPPEGYSSYSWYQEIKRRAEDGDEEAIRLLNQKQ